MEEIKTIFDIESTILDKIKEEALKIKYDLIYSPNLSHLVFKHTEDNYIICYTLNYKAFYKALIVNEENNYSELVAWIEEDERLFINKLIELLEVK